jgi:cell division protein ZapD
LVCTDCPLFDAINVVLRLLRESGGTTKVIAQAGSYQQMLQGKVYQLLRVSIAQGMGAIPEISANKYMLWIRIMSQDGDMKPKPYEGDVPFDLTLCNF